MTARRISSGETLCGVREEGDMGFLSEGVYDNPLYGQRAVTGLADGWFRVGDDAC